MACSISPSSAFFVISSENLSGSGTLEVFFVVVVCFLSKCVYLGVV